MRIAAHPVDPRAGARDRVVQVGVVAAADALGLERRELLEGRKVGEVVRPWE